jgi:hypothetical protein
MSDARFDDKLNTDYLEVGSYLSMRKAHFADDVGMAFVKISGPVDLSEAVFDGKLDAYGPQVGGYMSMQNARFADEVKLLFARFDNNVDLRGATIADLDLSGASIAGDLQLASENNLATWITVDGRDGDLNLRNAHIDNLMDEKEAWPKKKHLVLNGARFDHLGGHQGETEREMLNRGADWWDEHWAELNPQYSPSPYAQLAAAFTALGDRDNANEIRYRARERERAVAWEDRNRNWSAWGTWLLLDALYYIAGYGIGYHTFVVLKWVFVISVVAAALLWLTVPAARKRYEDRKFIGSNPRPSTLKRNYDWVRSFLWCLAASFNKLLPGIELKEFEWEFNDLKLWQRIAFSTLGIIGWILGGILILAVSGLTQN